MQNVDAANLLHPRLRLSKNCRLIQKEAVLQGEKGLKKGASPLFHLK